jgi:VanZ family protein
MARPFRQFVIAANLMYAAVLMVFGVSSNLPAVAIGITDRTAHGLAAAIQAAFLFALLLPSVGKRVAALLAAAGATLYGGLIETMQLFQPARTVEIADFAANAVGACAAAAIAFLLNRYAMGADE